MPKSIAELDPNFQAPIVEDGEDGLAWHAVSTLMVEGLGWAKESDAFCRLPSRAEKSVRAPVWELSRHSAGVLARFRCDAPQISARWDLRNADLAMPHMPASGVSGLDLYARDNCGKWRWCAAAQPTKQLGNEANLLENIAAGPHEYCLYAPLYNGISSLQIGVAPEDEFEFLPPRTEKIIGFYGTSIGHGGCASRPGMAYPAIVGRALDCPAINLGFSGNGQSESEVAALLSELNVAAWVLDPLPNMNLEQVRERIAPLVQVIRNAHAQLPIVLVENFQWQNDWLRERPREPDKNRALREISETLQKLGLQHLHYIEGKNLLGDDGEGTVDGGHPNDLGFSRIAGVLAPVLKAVLADA